MSGRRAAADRDPLRAARGVIVGTLLGACFWLLLGLTVWMATR